MATRPVVRGLEIFRVVRGTYRFWCDDEPPFDAPPGSVVAIPPGRRHAWQNVSEETGQMTIFATPGGLEQLFLDVAALEKPTMQQIAVIEQRLGITNDEVEKLTQSD